MKTIHLVLTICIVMLSLSINAQFERKSLIKMENGESLVMDESSVFGNVGDNFCLITVKYVNSKPNFYKWSPTGKTGPFTEDNLILCENITDPCSDKTEYITDEGDNNVNSQVEDDGTYFEYTGKKYGPYEMIMALKISSVSSKIYMAVTKGGKSFFTCTDGRSVELNGMPDMIVVSPDGNDAYIRTVGAYSMNELQNLAQNPEGIDFTRMNEINFTGVSGKKLGPFQSESISSWYSKYSDTWLLKVDENVYTDGLLWKSFESLYSYSFWFIDKQHHAYLSSDGQLIFSDGKTFDYPVCIRSERIGNNLILRWLAIESNEVVLYKKTL